MTRCAICGNRARHDRGNGVRECTHCGLRYQPGHPAMESIAADVANRLAAPSINLEAHPPQDWTCAIATLRIAGYRFGRAIRPANPAQAAELDDPTGTVPAAALAEPLPGEGPAITLGIMGRVSELATIIRLTERLAPHFAAVRVLIDSDDANVVAGLSGPGVAYLIHPLDQDFAAQRNRLQAACETPWQLQLDADEDLDAALLAALPGLAADADTHGLLSLAFQRSNLVDGVRSDHWPDVQYRLNRSEVRFAGVVHERPEPSRDWRRSALAPAGSILHRLDGAQVRARTKHYAAMASDGARPMDEEALLRPFSAD
ncbi:hypothetical protein [Sphingomonas prati]|uniref:Glycosyltransferase n=1 Tax=Sphingomonas prati TaxID=1843237 RepID=A0A7W9F0H6_9SPHN|nr:hypothetical protein [Sphingomonas prati]MBB5728238.1 hypothetical protein [Sphingomonas prati]